MNLGRFSVIFSEHISKKRDISRLCSCDFCLLKFSDTATQFPSQLRGCAIIYNKLVPLFLLPLLLFLSFALGCPKNHNDKDISEPLNRPLISAPFKSKIRKVVSIAFSSLLFLSNYLQIFIPLYILLNSY